MLQISRVGIVSPRPGPQKGQLMERGLEIRAEVWVVRLGWHGSREWPLAVLTGQRAARGTVGPKGGLCPQCGTSLGRPRAQLVWLTPSTGHLRHHLLPA